MLNGILILKFALSACDANVCKATVQQSLVETSLQDICNMQHTIQGYGNTSIIYMLVMSNRTSIPNITRIGVFACGQILCISPNDLQASCGINWIWFIPFSHCNKLTWRLHSAIYCIAPWKHHCCSHRNDEIAY